MLGSAAWLEDRGADRDREPVSPKGAMARIQEDTKDRCVRGGQGRAVRRGGVRPAGGRAEMGVAGGQHRRQRREGQRHWVPTHSIDVPSHLRVSTVCGVRPLSSGRGGEP